MANIPVVTQRSVLPSDQALPFSNAQGSRALQFIGQQAQQSGVKLKNIAAEMVAEYEKIQAEDNERELSKLDIELSSYLRTVKYGDGTSKNPGYLNTLGENAINGYGSVQQGINKKIEQLMKVASNDDVRKRFEIVAGTRSNQTLDELTNHVADQRLKSNAAVSDARIIEAVNNASASWSNPQALEEAFLINQAELGKRAVAEGWAEDLFKAALQEKNTLAIERTVSAAIIGNVGAAQSLLNRYGDSIDGFTKADLQDKIDAKRRQLVSEAEAAENRAERRKKRAQEEAFKDSYVAVEKGEKDASVLLEELANGTLDPSAYTFLTNRIDQKNAPDTGGNQNVYLDLSIALKTGAAEPSDIYKVVRDPSLGLNADQQNKLIEEAEQKTNNNPILSRDDVGRARNQITTVLEAPKGPAAKFDIGAADRYNNALREFDARILSNPNQNADALAQDVIKGYRPSPSTLGTLRKPEGWPSDIPWGTLDVNQLQLGISKTGENLQKKLESKDIDVDTFNEEVERLRYYLEMISKMQLEQSEQ